MTQGLNVGSLVARCGICANTNVASSLAEVDETDPRSLAILPKLGAGTPQLRKSVDL
jgi:hypothetical protein